MSTTTIKESPILFSAPMVRAILAGTKTQTRRVFVAKNGGVWPNKNDLPGMRQILRNCPYGQPSDRLWLRETWAAPHSEDARKPSAIQCDQMCIHYAASEPRGGLLWRPSIHMPRWASRITLEITGVRVERLQDISEADAMAEGIYQQPTTGWFSVPGINGAGTTARAAFALLWQSINGPGSWDANPWVWVLQFRRAA